MKRALVAASLLVALAAEAAPVRWTSQGDALTLDPHAINEAPTMAAAAQHYEGLVRRRPDLKVEPALAVAWRALGPTVWEFDLRPGVTFHDGTPFTAEDVVFSFKRAQAPTSDFRGYVAGIAVEAAGQLKVRMTTPAPNPILPDTLANLMVMSKAWAEANGAAQPQDFKGKAENHAVRHAMGTGPFALKRREPGVRTEWAANEAWWGRPGGPEIEGVVHQPVKSGATRVAALLTGQFDFMLDVPLQDVELIKTTPGLVLASTPQARTIMFGLDVASPELRRSSVKGRNPFTDPRVRRAMHLAIDAEAVRQKLMRGHSVPAGGFVSPGVRGYDPALDARPPHDVAAARRLLEEAGYPNGFDVALDCPNDRYANDEAICVAVTGMLAKAGIRVGLEARPKSQHFPKIQKRESDFYMIGFGATTLDAHFLLSFLVHSQDGKAGGVNYTGFSDPALDATIDAIRVETDADARAAMMASALKTASEALVYLPIHHQVVVWAMRSDLDLPISADDAPQFHRARKGGGSY